MIVQAVADLGRRTRLRGRRYLDRTRFVGALLRAALDYPAAARPLGWRIVLDQIRFTAVQALPLLSVVALAIGAIVITEVHAQAAQLGLGEVLGGILTTVVVREVGPLLTAVLVIGRSGTAITAELATYSVLGESESLEALGVDMLQYHVLPRILAMAVSVAVLTVWFDTVVLLGGSVVAVLAGGAVSLADYAASVRLALTPADLWLTLLKSGLFGTGIAILSSYEGLLGGRKSTDIPQCVTRGVVASLLFVVLLATVFSVLLFL